MAPKMSTTKRAPAHSRNRPPVDPRIKDRKVAVARAAGHRRLFAVIAVVLVIAFGIGAIEALHSSMFSAKRIVITGAVHTPAATIIASTGLGTHPPLLDVNTQRDAVTLEALPWVKTATVSRGWPTTVHIAITERNPIGEIALSLHRFAIVDASGRVLEDADAPISDVVSLTGIRAVPSPGGYIASRTLAIVHTAAATPLRIVSRIAFVGANAKDGVVVGLAHGPLVIFANDTDLRQKMVSLATVLSPSSKVALSGIATIDLRVPSSPVLTR
jgi:cell division protein FtsQ